ncbi:MAG: hypothetical protein IJ906_14000, partial [Oscillospiraceae bacterium]|nr:hypothetical protein [Oscillospiraceae bacterium]
TISFKANRGCRADTALPGSRGRAPRGVKGQSPLQGAGAEPLPGSRGRAPAGVEGQSPCRGQGAKPLAGAEPLSDRQVAAAFDSTL